MPDYTLPVSYTSVTRINSMYPYIGSATDISSDVIHQYAGSVEAEINARLAQRYTIPFTVQCPLLTAIATREAIYRIMVERVLTHLPSVQQGQHPLAVQHKDDQALLKQISEGTLDLVDSSGAIIAIPTDTGITPWSTTMTYQPTFHEGGWNDQVQDPDKIDDILTARDL